MNDNISPEIRAVQELATALELPVLYLDEEQEICVSIGRDANLEVYLKSRDNFEATTPETPWMVRFEFEVRAGKLATDPDALVIQLVGSILNVGHRLRGKVPS